MVRTPRSKEVSGSDGGAGSTLSYNTVNSAVRGGGSMADRLRRCVVEAAHENAQKLSIDNFVTV
jgi:hypothetical protein